MDKFGLIGYPVSHSPSPELFKAAYGGRWEYDIIENPEFEICWQRFLDEYKGINITIPFKEKAMQRVDVIHPECALVGATNLVVKTNRGLEAHNSDILAVSHILKERFSGGGKVLVAGDGGAGKAAAAAAKSLGMETIVCNRSARAGLRPLDELPALASEADILIYTLPCSVAGLKDIKCPCVLEANYDRPALAWNPNVGDYIPGIVWLRLQAMLGYEFLTGIKPDIKALSRYFK